MLYKDFRGGIHNAPWIRVKSPKPLLHKSYRGGIVNATWNVPWCHLDAPYFKIKSAETLTIWLFHSGGMIKIPGGMIKIPGGILRCHLGLVNGIMIFFPLLIYLSTQNSCCGIRTNYKMYLLAIDKMHKICIKFTLYPRTHRFCKCILQLIVCMHKYRWFNSVNILNRNA